MPHVDIYDVRMAVKSGRLKVEVTDNGLILLEDTVTSEAVGIGEIKTDGVKEAVVSGEAE